MSPSVHQQIQLTSEKKCVTVNQNRRIITGKMKEQLQVKTTPFTTKIMTYLQYDSHVVYLPEVNKIQTIYTESVFVFFKDNQCSENS